GGPGAHRGARSSPVDHELRPVSSDHAGEQEEVAAPGRVRGVAVRVRARSGDPRRARRRGEAGTLQGGPRPGSGAGGRYPGRIKFPTRVGEEMAREQFDLIVIGSGPGGYVAAIRAAQLG